MKLNLVTCAAVIVLASSNVLATEAKPIEVEEVPKPKAEIITEAESKTPKIFEQLDTNKDGKVSQQEAQVSPALVKGFDQIDTDNDGFISVNEFSQLQVEFTETRKYVALAALQAL